MSGPERSELVTLSYTPFDAVTDSGLLDSYRDLLDAEERRRELGFHFARDRERHVISHALLRTAVAREGGGAVAPERLEFTADGFGKPHLSGNGAPLLSFNLTHARGLAAVAVTRAAAVGIDAERIGGDRAAANDAAGLFATHEAEAIEACPPPKRAVHFLEHWTLKEAWAKATGRGLTLPFDRPAFRFPDERSIELCAEEDLESGRPGWKFWQLRIRDHFLVAVCVENRGGLTPRLQLRETVPLVYETFMPCHLLRQSA